MATVQFTCEHCERVLKVQAELAGSRAKCPGCGEVIEIPMAIDEVDEPPASASGRRRRSGRGAGRSSATRRRVSDRQRPADSPTRSSGRLPRRSSRRESIDDGPPRSGRPRSARTSGRSSRREGSRRMAARRPSNLGKNLITFAIVAAVLGVGGMIAWSKLKPLPPIQANRAFAYFVWKDANLIGGGALKGISNAPALGAAKDEERMSELRRRFTALFIVLPSSAERIAFAMNTRTGDDAIAMRYKAPVNLKDLKKSLADGIEESTLPTGEAALTYGGRTLVQVRPSLLAVGDRAVITRAVATIRNHASRPRLATRLARLRDKMESTDATFWLAGLKLDLGSIHPVLPAIFGSPRQFTVEFKGGQNITVRAKIRYANSVIAKERKEHIEALVKALKEVSVAGSNAAEAVRVTTKGELLDIRVALGGNEFKELLKLVDALFAKALP